MTKYVLNSGGLRGNSELAKEFFAEVVKDVTNNPKLLICCFAHPREDWEQKLVEDAEGTFYPEGVTPVFELAFPDKFEKQLKDSDIVYIHGGDDHLLLYWLSKFDIPEIWNGKVVATNSAGSNALATCFWTCDWRKRMDGLGILPIKFLSHYQSDYGVNDPRGPVDWDKAYKELQQHGDTTLPVHALKEGEYIVIEQ